MKSNFEKEVFELLNEFRKNPKCLEKECKLIEYGLKRLKPNDPFIKDIQTFVSSINSMPRMNPVELNLELCGYARKELEEFLKDPDDYPITITGKKCEGKISKEYMTENPGIIYDNGAEEPINVIPRLMLNKADKQKDARKLFTNPQYTQVGIARADYDDENYGVFIFANKIPKYDEIKGIEESDLLQYKKAFDLLDYTKDGIVPLNDIIDGMETAKLNESEPILYRILTDLKKENGPEITFPVFAKKMHSCFTDRKTKKGLSDIFYLLIGDPKQKTITLDNLKEISSVVGKKLSSEQLATILVDATKDGEITFDEFQEVMQSDKKKK